MTQVIKRGVNLSRTWEQVTAYWGSLLQNLVNTFIAVFYVPPYRPEWGKYSSWTESKIVKRRKTRRKMPRTCNKYDHDHSECERVILNVAGTIFETQLRSLNKYPDSLLGNPARRLRFYDPRTKEYYFDRHASSFEAIFHFFQSGGILQRPFSIPMETFCEECRFYDLGEEAITKLKKEEGYAVGDDQKVLPESLCKRKVWVLFEYPESSRQARVVTVFSVYVIVLSIVIFCTESVPSLKFKTLLDDKLPNIDDPFYFIETACVSWFSLELAVRFVTSPDKHAFLTSMMNIIDFISIIPYFVALVGRISPVTSSKSAQAYISLVRVIRLVRVFRIFKLSRHSKGLQILGLTLRASIRELGLLMFFLIIGVIIFSSAIYFAEEKTPNGNFTSIPTSFWWGVITMTTVGYGDVVPKSTFGKVVGSLCAIAGVLTIALPVPVIVSNFNYFYHRETERATEIDGVNPHEVMQCPFLSGKYDIINSNPSKTVTILGEQTQTKTRIHSNASILKSLKRARSGSQTAIPRVSD